MEAPKLIDLEKDHVQIPVHQFPQYRAIHAAQKNNSRRILLSNSRGIGDRICSEPTLRFAAKLRSQGFIDKLALASSMPELFEHIDFDEVFTGEYSNENWLAFQTAPQEIGLAEEFLAFNLINCVDAASLYAFRMQLPIEDKEILITSKAPESEIQDLVKGPSIYVHPGKHWPSKTFPRKWWNTVLFEIRKCGIVPILIGADVDQSRGTVAVDTTGCIDLRNLTTISEMAWLLQRATVVLTNDSAPLHLAASSDPKAPDDTGNAWIGFIATCKCSDMITHWRKGQWQWREVNFGNGGLWEMQNPVPCALQPENIVEVAPRLLESWLPDPKAYAAWAVEVATSTSH